MPNSAPATCSLLSLIAPAQTARTLTTAASQGSETLLGITKVRANTVSAHHRGVVRLRRRLRKFAVAARKEALIHFLVDFDGNNLIQFRGMVQNSIQSTVAVKAILDWFVHPLCLLFRHLSFQTSFIFLTTDAQTRNLSRRVCGLERRLNENA